MKKIITLLLLLVLLFGFASCKKNQTDKPIDNDPNSQPGDTNKDPDDSTPQPVKPNFDPEKKITAGKGTYRVTDRTNSDDLGYEIKYTRDIAVSSSPSLISPVLTEDPQVVNILEVPSSQLVRVVNWTYASRTNWSKQTVKNLAKDFERNNPGWIVLAGINGDFFDINGNGLLPYQTTSASVNNGDVVRAAGNNSASHAQVGFTNDGTADSFVGGKTFEVTSNHFVAVYDNSGHIIKEVEVNKLNAEPAENETSVYFGYYYWENAELKTRAFQKSSVPGTNSFTVASADRCYPNNDKQFFGLGNITKVNEEIELNIGQFSIVTKNAELANLLGENVRVRVQQNVIGDYAKCDNICGCGVHLVVDGKAPDDIEAITDYRHPRTIVGQKEDGTLFLCTIDGRQEVKNMYGMSYEEMSALMLYYDVFEGYNLDGGGSTTMIIRDKYGEFNVVNSPSDGSERSDSNAILVVAPGINMSVDSTSNNSVSCSYNAVSRDVTISNVKAVVTTGNKNITIDVADGEFKVEGLEKQTEYEVYLTCEMEYNGNKLQGKSFAKKFKTGLDPYTLTGCYYEDDGTNLKVVVEVDDPNRTVNRTYLVYGRKRIVLDTISAIYNLSKELLGEEKLYLEEKNELKGDPNSTLTDRYEIKQK